MKYLFIIMMLLGCHLAISQTTGHPKKNVVTGSEKIAIFSEVSGNKYIDVLGIKDFVANALGVSGDTLIIGDNSISPDVDSWFIYEDDSDNFVISYKDSVRLFIDEQGDLFTYSPVGDLINLSAAAVGASKFNEPYINYVPGSAIPVDTLLTSFKVPDGYTKIDQVQYVFDTDLISGSVEVRCLIYDGTGYTNVFSETLNTAGNVITSNNGGTPATVSGGDRVYVEIVSNSANMSGLTLWFDLN